MNSVSSLRRALRLNAGFSSISAVILFIYREQLGAAMGVDSRLLLAVGVGLAVFAGQLAFTAARDDLRKLRSESRLHSFADFAWVLASAVIVAGDWLTPLGNGLLLAVALPVLSLGIAQYRSLPGAEMIAELQTT